MKELPDITSPIPPRSWGKRFRRYQDLAAWYGKERAEVEISAHTAQPVCISALLDNVLSAVKRPENGVLITLRGKWSAIVGSMFARFCEPESLKDGVLTLKVRHSALLVELKPSCDLIVKQVNKVAGDGTCREIRLRA